MTSKLILRNKRQTSDVYDTDNKETVSEHKGPEALGHIVIKLQKYQASMFELYACLLAH